MAKVWLNKKTGEIVAHRYTPPHEGNKEDWEHIGTVDYRFSGFYAKSTFCPVCQVWHAEFSTYPLNWRALIRLSLTAKFGCDLANQVAYLPFTSRKRFREEILNATTENEINSIVMTWIGKLAVTPIRVDAHNYNIAVIDEDAQGVELCVPVVTISWKDKTYFIPVIRHWSLPFLRGVDHGQAWHLNLPPSYAYKSIEKALRWVVGARKADKIIAV